MQNIDFLRKIYDRNKKLKLKKGKLFEQPRKTCIL